MRDNCYLVVNASGVQRMTKTPPSLNFEGNLEISEEKATQMNVVEQLEFELTKLKTKKGD